MTTTMKNISLDTTASEQPSLRPLFDGSGKFRGFRRGRALIRNLSPLFEAADDASTTEFVDSEGNIFSSTVPVTKEQLAIAAPPSKTATAPQACRHGADCRGRPEKKGYCVMSHGNNTWCEHNHGDCPSASCEKAHFSPDFAKKEEKRKRKSKAKPTAADVVAEEPKRKPQPKSASVDPTPAKAERKPSSTPKRKPKAKPTAADVVAEEPKRKPTAAGLVKAALNALEFAPQPPLCHFTPCRNATCPKSHAKGQHQPDDTQCFHPACPDPVCAKTRHHTHTPNVKKAIACNFKGKCNNTHCPFAHPQAGAPQWCSKYYRDCKDEKCEGHHWKKGGIAKKAVEAKPAAKPTKKPAPPKDGDFPALDGKTATKKPTRKPAKKTASEVVKTTKPTRKPAEKTTKPSRKTMADVVGASVAKPKPQAKQQPKTKAKKSDLLMPEGVTIQEVDTTVVTEVKMKSAVVEKPKAQVARPKKETKPSKAKNSFAALEVPESDEEPTPVATAAVETPKAKKTRRAVERKEKEEASTAAKVEVSAEAPQEDDWFMGDGTPKPVAAPVTPTWSKTVSTAAPAVEEKPTRMLSLSRRGPKKLTTKKPSRLSLTIKKE